ncbi:CDGSH iron-sulfur domain-containing protein [Streptomyces sp. NPDC057702]|uniref:CDGSH iron-sulfur domain-containing protein n=1 Tax=unclassified Streptomyces TaxID=2593676 RepID=UPI0036798C9E
MPTAPESQPRRVRAETNGPVLIDGPVEIVLDDGTTAVSRRPVVAVCTCRRSRIHPWCDTSHRRRPHKGPRSGDGKDTP